MSLTLTFIALLGITGIIYIAAISNYTAQSINTYQHFVLQKILQREKGTGKFSTLFAVCETSAALAISKTVEYRSAVQECDATEA